MHLAGVHRTHAIRPDDQKNTDTVALALALATAPAPP